MKRFASALSIALSFLAAAPGSFAAEKLSLSVEIGEHPYLPNYEIGRLGTLGDVWVLDIEVLDGDGEPAEGAKVRLYNGKKSVGTGTVRSNGVAEVKLLLNKAGVQNLRVVASDDEPSLRGEIAYKIEVVKPKILNARTKVTRSEGNKPDQVLSRIDFQSIMDAGCLDIRKYWVSYPNQYLKENYARGVSPATWPFITSKRKGPMLNEYIFTFSEIIKIKNTIPYEVRDPDGELVVDYRYEFDEPVGTQVLCQTESGDLIILQ